jgi:hypothetical protein
MWRCGLIGLLYLTMVFAASAQDYDRDVISQDGPILYGTGMSPEDSREAWKHFWYVMTEAVSQQQGQEVLALKLKPRHVPETKECTIALDANLTGIGGISEPRKVMAMVVADCDDMSSQSARIVCTYPEVGLQFCRDFDTGKLLRD